MFHSSITYCKKEEALPTLTRHHRVINKSTESNTVQALPVPVFGLLFCK